MNFPLQLVDKPIKGYSYHVSWARTGCVWKCKEIDENLQTVTLVTPKTRKIIHNVKWSDLRHIRKNETK